MSNTQLEKVQRLLKKGTDDKLLYSRTHEAKEKLEKAYILAQELPPEYKMWRCLAAYRLAHLILRTTFKDIDLLEKAEQLMLEAVAYKKLGPLPSIYLLAILHRLSKLNPELYTKKIMNEYFLKAIDKVDKYNIEDIDITDSKDICLQSAQLQENLFNMIELSSYYLDISYNNLEGRGGSLAFDNMFSYIIPSSIYPTAWNIVGSDKGLTKIKYPEQIALSLIEDIGKEKPEKLIFKYSSDNDKGYWWKDGRWHPSNSNRSLRLLSNILEEKSRNVEELMQKVVGNKGTAANYRQIKRRLKKELSNQTGTPEGIIFVEDTGTELFRINKNIQIVGAVDSGTLQPF